MANELNIQLDPNYQTGLTVSADVKSQDGAVVDTVALAEVGVSGYYTGNFPSAAQGVYKVSFYTDTDTLLGVGEIHWNGSAEIGLNDIVTEIEANTGINRIVVKNLKATLSTKKLIGKVVKVVL